MYSNTLVSTEDLARHLDDPQWVVFDCRFTLTDPEAGRRAYAEAHIPGAHYAHLDEDLSGPIVPGRTGRHPLPDPQVLAEKLYRWGVGVNKQVVVYDDSFGAMAVRMWWLLRWLGHPAVALLDGGLPKWRREMRPLTSEPPPPRKGNCVCLPEPSQVVTAEDVMRVVRGEEPALIIDARPERRFTGEFEPLDPVAGHVPGAINWNFEDNLDLDGTFLPPEALRENFQALLKGRAPWQVIHMCGSGVTACHNILAMEIAGLPGSRLYPGSWSEWITDPSRPIATGE
ncbi:MAG: sulfurtransferase [Thiobacillaceae bacterium]|nr:sulfurtransferase [Thiobacillaceae bacterium]MCX7673315.1 sulfurtransferase [Thiobacillaceae bacterium]MDW8322725.1 sulfurtransferase [Burkholderiales bacterium]